MSPFVVGSPSKVELERDLPYLKEIFLSNWLTNNGRFVQAFEEELKSVHKCKHCFAVVNGTAGLEIALKALERTGEVIVPAFTFIASVHAISWVGLKPVLVDVLEDTHNIDPDRVKEAINENTAAIMGVHLWGNACDIHRLNDISCEYGIPVVFDAAHAFGCTYSGIPIVNFGDCSVMSFHATKILNTFEGGAIFTNSDRIAHRINLLRNFGKNAKEDIVSEGTNGKMSEVSAAMGLANLSRINEFIKGRYNCFQLYKQMFNNVEGVKLLDYSDRELNNYQYIVVQLLRNVDKRADIIRNLKAMEVYAKSYFSPGCHEATPYKTNKYFPVAATLSKSVIVLPIIPEYLMRSVHEIFKRYV